MVLLFLVSFVSSTTIQLKHYGKRRFNDFMNNFCELAARLNNISIILQWLLISFLHTYKFASLYAYKQRVSMFFLSFVEVALIFKLIMANDFRTGNSLWHICFHFLRFPETSKGVSRICCIHDYLHTWFPRFCSWSLKNSSTRSYMRR